MKKTILDFVPYFIGFVFCLIVTIYMVIGVFAVKGYNYIKDNGLKSTINAIWEGPND